MYNLGVKEFEKIVIFTIVTSVQSGQEPVPAKFDLRQNYPNPFNPVTQINYTVPNETRVLLTVYDLLGKKVRTLLDDIQLPGSHMVRWDGNDNAGLPVSSGLYFYEMRAGEFRQVCKMTLIR
jgi:hypothetical protein